MPNNSFYQSTGNAYTYASGKPHAVTSVFGNTYDYDPNGNQTTRVTNGYTYTLGYDAENRMTGVQRVALPPTQTASFTPTHFLYLPIVTNGDSSGQVGNFVYDAGGNRVKGTVNGVTVVYIAGLYEWQAGATTTYYDGGVMRRSG